MIVLVSFAAVVVVFVPPSRVLRLTVLCSLLSSPFINNTNKTKPNLTTVDEEAGVLRADPALGFEHPFPPTCVAFIPDRSGSAGGTAPRPCSPSPSSLGNTPDLLATSGDFLRIWKIESGGDDVYGNGMATDEYEDGEDDDEGDGGGDDDGGGGSNGAAAAGAAARRSEGRRRRRSVADAATAATTSGRNEDEDEDEDYEDDDGNGTKGSGPGSNRRGRGGPRTRLLKLLNNNKHSEFCAPLTSFDWNDADARRLGTASIDTTCTIWDVERGVVDTQLIAHDREVFDIAWGGVGVFASVSADGSVRVFDLRDKEHSTIIYESPTPDNTPLLRLAWNRQDPRYMACLAFDSSSVAVLDIRFPAAPVASLARHAAPANALAWAPHSSCHLCTAGDDAQALIWDLSAMARPASVVAGGSAGGGGGVGGGGGLNSSAGMGCGGGGSRGGGGNTTSHRNDTRSGGTAMTPGVSDPRGMGGGSRGNGGGNPTATMSNTTTVGGGGNSNGIGGGAAGGGGGAAGAAVTGLDPILAYSAGAEICGLQWSSAAPDWVAICFANKMQILRV